MFSQLDLRPAAQIMRTTRDSLQTASPPFGRWFQCVSQLAVLGLFLGVIACSSARSAFADADEAQAKVGEQECNLKCMFALCWSVIASSAMARTNRAAN